MATMTLGTVSICMTVVILNVHHRGPRQRMPPWLRVLCFVYLARILCVRTATSRRYGRGSTRGNRTFPAGRPATRCGLHAHGGSRTATCLETTPDDALSDKIAAANSDDIDDLPPQTTTMTKNDDNENVEGKLVDGREPTEEPIWKRRRLSRQQVQQQRNCHSLDQLQSARDAAVTPSRLRAAFAASRLTTTASSSHSSSAADIVIAASPWQQLQQQQQRRCNGNATASIAISSGNVMSNVVDDAATLTAVAAAAAAASDLDCVEDPPAVVGWLRQRMPFAPAKSSSSSLGGGGGCSRRCPCRSRPVGVRHAAAAAEVDREADGRTTILRRLAAAMRRLVTIVPRRRQSADVESSASSTSRTKQKKYAAAASFLALSALDGPFPGVANNRRHHHHRCRTTRSSTGSDVVVDETDCDDSDDVIDDAATVTEWRELARLLDRLCFWLLFTLMTASAIIILLYPKYTGNETGWYMEELT